MFKSPIRTIKRASSESSFRRKVSSSVTRPRIDPFSELNQQVAKTPSLKPTCHKTASSEKKLIMRPTLIKNPENLAFGRSRFSNKFNKISPTFKNKTNCRVLTEESKVSEEIFINPTFSKNSSRSIKSDLKPVMRVTKVPVKQGVRAEGFQKQMIKRVNNLVFKEKGKRYKSALEFSFANPSF